MSARRACQPQRTCVACRRAAPQRGLLRIARSPEGLAEVDPRRRAGGRGAYLCRRPACLDEVLRRGRWAQLFRAPTTMPPATVARLRAWCCEAPGVPGAAVAVQGSVEGGD